MKMRVGACVLCVVGPAALGQTFVTYIVDGENLATGERGHEIRALAGDTIRVAVRPVHDAMSFGSGRIDVLLEGVFPEDIGVLEEDGKPWELGRTPVMRIGGGDSPDGNFGGNVSARPDTGFYGVDTVITDDQFRVDFTGWFDFASTPPGLGGLAGVFPVESGDRLFVFDFIYVGGRVDVGLASFKEARLWRDQQDISGALVPADVGLGLIVAGCPADLDGDGDADVDDFFAYLDGFAAGDLDVCDLDGSGDCDADDFFGYLDLFAAGC